MAAETMEWETTGGDNDVWSNAVTAQNVMDIIMMDVEMANVDDSVFLRGQEVIVVPDTNIFIHSLHRVRVLVGEDSDDSSPSPTFPRLLILPWMVLQELDGLRKKNRGAQLAINYINELLLKKHPRLRPQRPSELAESKDEFPGSNEDDSILQCALHWCRKLSQAHVVFMTNDKNLRNKAMAVNNENLIVCDGDSALKEIKRLTLEYTNSSDVARLSCGKKNLDNGKGARNKSNRSTDVVPSPSRPKRQLIQRKLSTDFSPIKEVKDTSRKRGRSPAKPHSDVIPEASFTPIRKRTPKNVSSDLKCESFADASKILRNTVAYIIEFQMKEDFGDNWLQCLKISPPWTLETGLKCILLHWIAVFSFVFGKSKKSVENFYEEVRSYNKKFGNRRNEEASSSAEIEEDILELSMQMFNAVEFNKASVATEPYFVHSKRIILDYIRKRKDD